LFGVRCGASIEAQSGAPRLHDRLPARTAAQVGQERRFDSGVGYRPGARLEGGQPEQDARGAKAALAGPGGGEGPRPPGPELGIEPLDRGDRSAGDPPDRGDAGDTGGTVDPDRAAATLALGAAAVLDRMARELFTQGVEQRDPQAVVNLDRGSVEDKGNGRRRGGVAQLKEEPQPQVRVALGFTMWNPAPCSPSL